MLPLNRPSAELRTMLIHDRPAPFPSMQCRSLTGVWVPRFRNDFPAQHPRYPDHAMANTPAPAGTPRS